MPVSVSGATASKLQNFGILDKGDVNETAQVNVWKIRQIMKGNRLVIELELAHLRLGLVRAKVALKPFKVFVHHRVRVLELVANLFSGEAPHRFLACRLFVCCSTVFASSYAI
jgi:hypothetical protein